MKSSLLFNFLISVLITYVYAVETPLSTLSRWIVNAKGQRVKFRCVNWATHMEMHVAEGLAHQNVDNITSLIASKFNCVRLTYSVEMALNPNITVSEAFADGAARAGIARDINVANLFLTTQKLNTNVKDTTTVLQAFETIIESLNKRGVMVILDNHVSRASWCCSATDGNGWWKQAIKSKDENSRFFDAIDWITSLRQMAQFAKKHSNVVGMSLRNELRPTSSQTVNDWYKFIQEGATAIHQANPDLLIMVGGTSYATDLSFLFKTPLDRRGFENKIVWEVHNYVWSFGSKVNRNCKAFAKKMGRTVGFLLRQNEAYTGPLWMSEFGVSMDLTDDEQAYLKCLVEYMISNDADWSIWALQGSYYVRDGQPSVPEPYGLLNDNWSDWRNPMVFDLLGDMWKQTQGPGV